MVFEGEMNGYNKDGMPVAWKRTQNDIERLAREATQLQDPEKIEWKLEEINAAVRQALSNTNIGAEQFETEIDRFSKGLIAPLREKIEKLRAKNGNIEKN